MTTITNAAIYDLVQDSTQLLEALERQLDALPAAGALLEQHQQLHRELLHRQQSGERAIEEWRRALARRWECEVAGQRLYLNVQRELVAYFGPASQALLIFLRGDEREHDAAQLLADLRQLHAALAITHGVPTAATDYLPDLVLACDALDDALHWSNRCEQQRHRAFLDRHLSQQAYQQVRERTQRTLATPVANLVADMPVSVAPER
ncbi:MAG: hypothetical protein H7Y32_00240 [Chloroflexales bacterium]|nr:hypothetical protein [Chloroflexales bacterium]